jgi:hypothetical protein
MRPECQTLFSSLQVVWAPWKPRCVWMQNVPSIRLPKSSFVALTIFQTELCKFSFVDVSMPTIQLSCA